MVGQPHGNRSLERTKNNSNCVLLCSINYSVSGIETKHHLGDQIRKTEINGACSTYGREERCIQGFSEES
jgi:hypothetical protein